MGKQANPKNKKEANSMKRNKVLSLLLAILLFVTITACSTPTEGTPTPTDKTGEGQTAEEPKEPSEQSPSEPVTITAAIPDKVNVEDYNTNDVTIWLEEELNIDLEFTVYESTDYNSKINLMVSGGDALEDIIFGGFPDTMVYEWARNEALQPITKYFDDESLAIYLNDAMARVGYDFRGAITLPDGEIYYIPKLNQSYGNEYAAKAWIYEPWLEELGVSVPKTTDDFYNLLKQVAESDMNENGIADEVGLAGYNGIYSMWFSYIMSSFVYTDSDNSFMKVENNELSYSFTDDAWRKGIEYLIKLVDEGLVPTETVTQDWDSWLTMINSNDPTVLSLVYYVPDTINDVQRKTDYIIMPPLEGPDGLQYARFNPSKPTCGMVVSADCENPELAFRVGDLLVSEEHSITTRWGARGEDWDYVEDLPNASEFASLYQGFDPYIVAYNDAEFWASGTMQNRSWMQEGPYIRHYGIATGVSVDPDTITEFAVRQAEGLTEYQEGGYAPDQVIEKLIYNDQETEVVTSVSATLTTYIEETMANWIMGNEELNDNSWNVFLETLDEIGAYDMLEAAQSAYDRSVN